jgi:ATP-dependent Clp protease, protease subunit
MLTIVLYEAIGEGDSTAKAVLLALSKVSANTPLTVAISSPGGSVFEGEAIYNALKRHKGRVTARIDGRAFSAASYIMCAADEIIMAPGAHILIHSPMAMMVEGNQEEFRAVIDRLEVMERQYCRVYSQKTGQDEARIREWMKAETWFTAEQAIQAGFADRIDDDISIAAVFPDDLTRFGYRHIPVAVRAMHDPAAKPLTEQKIEAAKPEPTAEELAERLQARQRRQRQRRRMTLLAEMRPGL